MAKQKFGRGETTYKCQCCGKLTRNTGDEGASTLCFDCYELAGIENYLTDNGVEETKLNYSNEINGIFERRPDLVTLHRDLARFMTHENKVKHFGPENTWADRHDI